MILRTSIVHRDARHPHTIMTLDDGTAAIDSRVDASSAPMSFSSSSSQRRKRYVVVNGLRYVVPHLHEFIIKVSEKRVGGSVGSALAAHVKFQGQVSDGGREFWVGHASGFIGHVIAHNPRHRQKPTPSP